MPRRIKLIFNPHADKGRAWNVASDLQSIIERHEGAEWIATEYPSHASEIALRAAESGYDIVVAVGGDGTVHETVNGLMQMPPDQRPCLAVVPLGSGNDFCGNTGGSILADEAMHRVFHGEPTSVDLGVIEDDTGQREFWDNTLGIGFDAKATINTRKIYRLQGFAMYFYAVLKTILMEHDAPHFHINVDGEVIERDLIMVTLCNGPREGGGFFVAPEARTDDGWLDYAMVEYVSRGMMFRLLPEFLRGTHGRFRQVRLGKFHKMELEADRPLIIHADGEIFASHQSNVRKLKVEILPNALQLIV